MFDVFTFYCCLSILFECKLKTVFEKLILGVAIFQFLWFVKNSTKPISYGVVIEKCIKTRISLSFE